MSQVDHIDDIAFSTAFEIDKVIPGSKVNGSFSVAGFSTVGTQTHTNSWGENVFPVMIWSTDGTKWFTNGERDSSFDGTFAKASANVYTTSTQIVVVAINFSDASLTFQYKVLLLSEN